MKLKRIHKNCYQGNRLLNTHYTPAEEKNIDKSYEVNENEREKQKDRQSDKILPKK